MNAAFNPRALTPPLTGQVRPDASPGELEAPAVKYRTPEKSIRRVVAEAWAGRHVLPGLALWVVARMYSRTYLGRAWMFIRPFMDVVGGALLFGGVLKVSSEDGTPYILFLAAGILGWRVFERSLRWVTRSFDRCSRVTNKVDFPLLLVPIGGCSPAFVDMLLYSLILVLVAMAYLVIDGQFWLHIELDTFAAVGGLVLCLTFGVAVGLFTSILNAHTHDVKRMLPYFLQIGMFVTPVIYPITKLPPSVQPFAQANPMAAPIELVKHGLLGSGNVQLWPVLWSIGAALLFLVLGLWFFSRRASNFMGPTGWGGDDEEDELL